MSNDQLARCLELPAGTRHVEFADLPHLIAVALWPEDDPPSQRRDFAYGGARINLEEELPRAVADGRLLVRDPLTLGLHTFPVGDALQRSVVLLEDLRAFLVKRGGGIEVLVMPEDNASDLIPLGLIAKDAAMRETPPVPGENDLRRDIRTAVRKTTEDDFARRLSAYLAQGKLKAVNPLNGAPYDPELSHLDPGDPMWALDNVEYEKALEMLGQLKRTDEAGRVGMSVQSTAEHAAEAAARDSRQARGFYTLCEAAQLLAGAHGLNAEKLRQQLTSAFAAGLLVVRDPETQAPLDSGRVRDFHDWVTADDIDELLSAWRVAYRFPLHGNHDVTLSRLGSPPITQDQDASTVGPSLSSDETCEAFDGVGMSSSEWRVTLTKNRPAWLMSCSAAIGKPGAEPVQGRWYPLKIAKALVRSESRKAGAVPAAELDAAFRRPTLRTFASEWKALRFDNPAWGDVEDRG